MPLFRPGERISKYAVVRLLGRGGMGALYLAFDESAARSVVIKVMLDPDADPAANARFAREARAAAAVRHTNIITVYEVGEHNGQPFIAMEYVAGETLAQIVKRQAPLPIVRKLQILEELCAGVYAAHRVGVVHRDLKPANIMLDVDGVVRILDFGIARTSSSDVLTHEGAIVGTLNYMSPEQLAGLPLDYRSDIFSVGAVAYELFSYQQAFPGTGLDGVGHRIQAVDPTGLADVCPGLDDGIVHVVRTALQKDPARRYGAISTMGADLAAIRSRLVNLPSSLPAETPGVVRTKVRPREVPPSDSPSRPVPASASDSAVASREWFSSIEADAAPERLPRQWIAGGIAALVAVIAVGLILARRPEPATRVETEISTPEKAPLVPAGGSTPEARGPAPRPGPPARDGRPDSATAGDGVAPRNDRFMPDAIVAEARTVAETDPGAAVRRLEPLLSDGTGYPEAMSLVRELLRSAERQAQQARSSATAAQAHLRAEDRFAAGEEALADARDAESDGRYGRAYELMTTASETFQLARAAAGVTTTAALTDSVAERDIRQALDRYEAAFTSMSGAAVKRIVPSLSTAEVSALDRAFVDARDYRLNLEDVRISRRGVAATVVARVRRVIENRSGETRQVSSIAEISLEYSDGGWVITRVAER